MTVHAEEPRSRRAFLRFLAGSPLFACVGLTACTRGTGAAGFGASTWSGQDGAGALEGLLGEAISSADSALDVFDFKTVAAQNLPPAHYGYLATGVDGEATLRANREGFERLFLRPRRLVDVTKVDTSKTLFGVDWETPIALAPAGSQRTFHPDAELASARAARAKRHLQILSTVTSTPVEDVVEARGEPVWYQLYPTSRWSVTQAVLRRAEDAGCPVVVLTVDLPAPSNRETVTRYSRLDDRDCSGCHPAPDVGMRNKPMYQGTDMSGVADFFASGLTWDFISRLRDATDMNVVLKGIVTREDAARCLAYGVDGIIVSNHGGRAEESGRGTIESLPEVVEAVGGAIPIMIDGGFRRGTDVFKALALGADAVCIGRPYLWGLGAFGQPGVEKVLDILRAELETVMRLVVAPTLEGIGSSFVGET